MKKETKKRQGKKEKKNRIEKKRFLCCGKVKNVPSVVMIH